MHASAHPLAGKTVKLNLKKGGEELAEGGDTYRIEDWWDRVAGKSWMDANGNPVAMNYGIRSGLSGLPIDNEVVYGKIGPFGHLIHVSELGDPV